MKKILLLLFISYHLYAENNVSNKSIFDFNSTNNIGTAIIFLGIETLIHKDEFIEQFTKEKPLMEDFKHLKEFEDSIKSK